MCDDFLFDLFFAGLGVFVIISTLTDYEVGNCDKYIFIGQEIF